MKRCLRRDMKVTWSVNLSTVGGVSIHVRAFYRCLLETTKFTKKRPVRPRSASTLSWAAQDLR